MLLSLLSLFAKASFVELSSFPYYPRGSITWKLTLKSRTVDVHRSHDSSFLALVNNPAAFAVRRDSGPAVTHLYPSCFGAFWFPPTTRFDFLVGHYVRRLCYHRRS
jgi:hypothetical protein